MIAPAPSLVTSLTGELEEQADRHYDRCRDCRSRRACPQWDAYWQQIAEVSRGR